ncbi:hypothetical protein SERLA73DRAFT_138021, partial [Serpula lacrymans var. lacrymans S7.3]
MSRYPEDGQRPYYDNVNDGYHPYQDPFTSQTPHPYEQQHQQYENQPYQPILPDPFSNPVPQPPTVYSPPPQTHSPYLHVQSPPPPQHQPEVYNLHDNPPLRSPFFALLPSLT